MAGIDLRAQPPLSTFLLMIGRATAFRYLSSSLVVSFTADRGQKTTECIPGLDVCLVMEAFCMGSGEHDGNWSGEDLLDRLLYYIGSNGKLG